MVKFTNFQEFCLDPRPLGMNFRGKNFVFIFETNVLDKYILWAIFLEKKIKNQNGPTLGFRRLKMADFLGFSAWSCFQGVISSEPKFEKVLFFQIWYSYRSRLGNNNKLSLCKFLFWGNYLRKSKNVLRDQIFF